jgi:hypothetical protein
MSNLSFTEMELDYIRKALYRSFELDENELRGQIHKSGSIWDFVTIKHSLAKKLDMEIRKYGPK